MMKAEFEELVGIQVSSKDYEAIEFVYTWHPSISDTNGKKQIAEIYNTGGMLVINAMLEAAMYMQKLDGIRRGLEKKLNDVKERELYVRSGCLGFERCINAMYDLKEATESTQEFNKLKEAILYPKYSIKEINTAEEVLGLK